MNTIDSTKQSNLREAQDVNKPPQGTDNANMGSKLNTLDNTGSGKPSKSDGGIAANKRTPESESNKPEVKTGDGSAVGVAEGKKNVQRSKEGKPEKNGAESEVGNMSEEEKKKQARRQREEQMREAELKRK